MPPADTIVVRFRVVLVRDSRSRRRRDTGDEIVEKHVYVLTVIVQPADNAKFGFVKIAKVGQANRTVNIRHRQRQDFVHSVQRFILFHDTLQRFGQCLLFSQQIKCDPCINGVLHLSFFEYAQDTFRADVERQILMIRRLQLIDDVSDVGYFHASIAQLFEYTPMHVQFLLSGQMVDRV